MILAMQFGIYIFTFPGTYESVPAFIAQNIIFVNLQSKKLLKRQKSFIISLYVMTKIGSR